ncbi:unnamed protein product [Caenorhabditis angaria]|uniref:Galactosylgalactosylxylosylprotein 3-beta-glucuronosyltransferase n=1 Tax=Caenorhabditis angaria TaxID=860376 RepID=A0A9P1N7V5_9PELO|nr:unnamed protein product [Caenorhabditis angaria]
MRILLVLIYCILAFVIITIYKMMNQTSENNSYLDFYGETLDLRRDFEKADNQSLIIVITPTYYRLTQLPDMTRMANTLMHVKNLHWIVIEDGEKKNENIESLLKRSNISNSYFTFKTKPGYPKRGWYQRSMALTLLRRTEFNNTNAVVFFGDDDNSYDIRLFTEYIRNVKKLGMWAVGHAGGGIAANLNVVKGKVIDFDVSWGEWRKFGIDMAGFAIHLDFVLKTDAIFHGKICGRRTPETCLLEEMHFSRDDIEPFGYETNGAREIYRFFVCRVATQLLNRMI